MALILVTVPGSARASVSFRAASCGQSSATTTLTLPVPSGTVAGDLLVATVGAAGATLANPAGWTQAPGLSGTVGGGQELVTWYRFAAAPIPASYAFMTTSSADAFAGGINAFAGVWTTTPISGTPAQRIESTVTTSDVLPNATGTYPGSMRYSAAGSDDATIASYPNPMTMSCAESNNSGIDMATSTAWEPTGVGTTATRTMTRSDNARSVLQTLVLNAIPCSTGGLNLTAPSSVAFPSVLLDGTDKTRASVMSLGIDDETGTGAGWNVTATSTTFTNGASTLPTDAAKVTGASATAQTGDCAMPTNSITYPVTIPAGTVAPTATKIYNAASTSGRGPVAVDLAVSLAVPARARIGTYTSTWNITLVAGP